MKRKMYKGSSSPNVEVFEPQPVFSVDVGKLRNAGVEADKVVWVTATKEYALPFSILIGKVKFGLFYDKKFPKYRLSIHDTDYAEKINLDEKAYLYELEDTDYIDVYGPESISLKPVKVISCEEYTVREVFKNFDVYVPTKWAIE